MGVFWFFFAKKNERFFFHPGRAQKKQKFPQVEERDGWLS
jgi:hypothetical protein